MNFKKSHLILLILISLFIMPTTAWAQDGGGIVRIGKDITVLEGEKYDAVVGIGNNIKIDGTIGDALVAIGSNLELGGHVGNALVIVGADAHMKNNFTGDLVLIGSNVTLDPGVTINGEIVSLGSNIQKGDNAQIIGNQVDVNIENIINNSAVWGPPLLAVLLGFILVGSVIFALLTFLAGVLFPTGINRSKHYLINNPGPTFLVGLILFIFFLPINFILLITLIGIPLIPMFWLIYGVLVIWGISVIADIIGSKILNAFKYQGNSTILPLIIGILIFYLLALVPIIGWLTMLLIKILALGTGILTHLGFRKIDEATN